MSRWTDELQEDDEVGMVQRDGETCVGTVDQIVSGRAQYLRIFFVRLSAEKQRLFHANGSGMRGNASWTLVPITDALRRKAFIQRGREWLKHDLPVDDISDERILETLALLKEYR